MEISSFGNFSILKLLKFLFWPISSSGNSLFVHFFGLTNQIWTILRAKFWPKMAKLGIFTVWIWSKWKMEKFWNAKFPRNWKLPSSILVKIATLAFFRGFFKLGALYLIPIYRKKIKKDCFAPSRIRTHDPPSIIL